MSIRIPEAIKTAAIITAMPRWMGALLIADGLTIPSEWEGFWRIFSLVFAAAMAVVEGLSFSYVFNRWKNTRAGTRKGDNMLILSVISAIVFVVVLTPYVAMQAKRTGLTEILGSGVWLFAWAAAVSSSTILVVMSVGYAQEKSSEKPEKPGKKKGPQKKLSLKDKLARCSGPDDFVELAIEHPELLKLEPGRLASIVGRSEKTGQRWIKRAERKMEQVKRAKESEDKEE